MTIDEQSFSNYELHRLLDYALDSRKVSRLDGEEMQDLIHELAVRLDNLICA